MRSRFIFFAVVGILCAWSTMIVDTGIFSSTIVRNFIDLPLIMLTMLELIDPMVGVVFACAIGVMSDILFGTVLPIFSIGFLLVLFLGIFIRRTLPPNEYWVEIIIVAVRGILRCLTFLSVLFLLHDTLHPTSLHTIFVSVFVSSVLLIAFDFFVLRVKKSRSFLFIIR